MRNYMPVSWFGCLVGIWPCCHVNSAGLFSCFRLTSSTCCVANCSESITFTRCSTRARQSSDSSSEPLVQTKCSFIPCSQNAERSARSGRKEHTFLHLNRSDRSKRTGRWMSRCTMLAIGNILFELNRDCIHNALVYNSLFVRIIRKSKK